MQAEERECTRQGGGQKHDALVDLPVVYTARAEGIEEEWVGSGKDLDRCLGTDHCSVSSLFRGTVTQRTAGLR